MQRLLVEQEGVVAYLLVCGFKGRRRLECVSVHTERINRVCIRQKRHPINQFKKVVCILNNFAENFSRDKYKCHKVAVAAEVEVDEQQQQQRSARWCSC